MMGKEGNEDVSFARVEEMLPELVVAVDELKKIVNEGDCDPDEVRQKESDINKGLSQVLAVKCKAKIFIILKIGFKPPSLDGKRL